MKTLLIWLALVFANFVACAQSFDTLRLKIPEAEKQFAKVNFSLLAQKYNIEVSKAAIIQARLLPNPNVNIEQTIITTSNVANNENIGAFGQRAFQIQQLILLGGKRSKQIEVAKINGELSEYQFTELVRELVYQLRSKFYDVHFLQKTLFVYRQEIQNIAQLVIAYKEQVVKGNLPLKEVIRLESFLIGLQSEQANVKKQIIDNEAVIKILLSDNSSKYIYPDVDDTVLDSLTPQPLVLSNLISDATENRPDRKIQDASIRLASANLMLQKALAKPDIIVGYSYDRAGSYVNNYHALTASMSLPFFNRNQGNIKAAENQISAGRQYLAQADNQLNNDVLQAFAKANMGEELYRKMDKQFILNFKKLIDGVVENYKKRNLTLIEFTDFLESYKNTVRELNAIEADRMQAFEYLNFVVGKRIMN